MGKILHCKCFVEYVANALNDALQVLKNSATAMLAHKIVLGRSGLTAPDPTSRVLGPYGSYPTNRVLGPYGPSHLYCNYNSRESPFVEGAASTSYTKIY